MMNRANQTILAAAALLVCSGLAQAADLTDSLKKGTPDIQAAGPLAFGPEGILFVGDPRSAAVFAIATGDTGGGSAARSIEIEKIDGKIASALGTQPQNILINDVAVNPASGSVYLSVSRGRGPDAQPVLLRVAGSAKIEEVLLKDVPFAKAVLPNTPADAETGPADRRRNERLESITDLRYVDGRVIVAGLSNEEFASKLRSIPFPFRQQADGASVEIFHGAHGKFETRSPVRTFIDFEINGEPYILAGYTCTPLVKFPLKDLKPGTKVQGTTIAELGNRNRPLDMIVYEKDGSQYILMANSARGVMKITTEGIDKIAGIEERVADTAGLGYETIADLQGVEQLDRLSDDEALVLVRQESGQMDLRSIALP